MTELNVTVISTSITAIAAIIAPIITAAITARSHRKIRQLEILDSKLQPAITKLTDAYCALRDSKTLYYFWPFLSAAHNLIGLVDDRNIQTLILSLLTTVRNLPERTNNETDQMMYDLMVSMAKYQAKA